MLFVTKNAQLEDLKKKNTLKILFIVPLLQRQCSTVMFLTTPPSETGKSKLDQSETQFKYISNEATTLNWIFCIKLHPPFC